MNIISVYKQFPTEESCIIHLEKIRWKDGVFCPYCDSKRITPAPKEHRHHCNACNKTFSVTVKTIFHRTHLPLQTWFLAIALMLNAKKGLSGRQLARDLDINPNTAWRITMKIREAMKYDGELLTGIVEMDETYVGGKPRKQNNKRPMPGPKKKKPAVVGAVSRDNGQIVTEIVPSEEEVTINRLNQFVRGKVDLESTLLTDRFAGYREVKEFIDHLTVNHSKEYVSYDGVHINTIESFWAIVKRGVVGQYHKVSARYLSRYLDEFTFRYNHRKTDICDVFHKTIIKGLL